jgi:hypothetical protein
MKNFMTALFIFLAVSGTAAAGDFHPEANAELDQNHFWSEVNFQPNSNVIVTNFRALFDKPANKVFPTLIDTNGLPRVHGNYEDAAELDKSTFDAIVSASPKDADAVKPLIKKAASGTGRNAGGRWTRYEYLNFNFPWPLSNRWTVQKADIDESGAAKGHYRYVYKMHVGNFKALDGFWELVPVAGKPGWTEFRGSYKSDAGVALPKFVTKSAAKTGLKRDVEDNRRVLGSK